MDEFSIIIPAHNEQFRIEKTTLTYIKWCRTEFTSFEIIIVNNGSTDYSQGVIEQLSANYHEVRYIEISQAGKGLAIKTGVLEANGQCILIADSDCSVEPCEIKKLMDQLNLGSDIVIGSRMLPQSDATRSLARFVIARGMNLFANSYLKTQVTDHFCGFKLFTIQAAKVIFAQQKIKGYAFDPEIIYIARKANLTVYETAIKWREMPGSKVKIYSIFQVIFDLLRIKNIHRYL